MDSVQAHINRSETRRLAELGRVYRNPYNFGPKHNWHLFLGLVDGRCFTKNMKEDQYKDWMRNGTQFLSQGLGLHILPIETRSSKVVFVEDKHAVAISCSVPFFIHRDGLTWDTVADCKINWTYGGPGEKQMWIKTLYTHQPPSHFVHFIGFLENVP